MADDFHYYEPEKGHGLPHNPFNAIVGPRPIGWISTRDAAGRFNLAPYSFFNAFAYTPPIIGFASTGEKDTLRNVRATGEFAALLTGPSASFTQRLGNSEVLLSYESIAEKGWYVVSVIPKETLLAPMNKLRRGTGYIVVVPCRMRRNDNVEPVSRQFWRMRVCQSKKGDVPFRPSWMEGEAVLEPLQ